MDKRLKRSNAGLQSYRDGNGAEDIAMAANRRKPTETMMSLQQSGGRTMAKTETEVVE